MVLSQLKTVCCFGDYEANQSHIDRKWVDTIKK